MTYNIMDFGAVADGKTMNTEAINRAIETCANAGGGRVVVPSGGVFMSGTIWLKSHVELHLEQGATLKASGDFADYNANDAYEQNYEVPDEMWNGAHFIIALECEDVAITGGGVIDGNAQAFVDETAARPFAAWHQYHWFKGFWLANRPGQSVNFVECRHVRVEGVTMRDLPSWCLFLFGCDYVQVHGISVFNPPYMANTDGIDIDACRYVTVSDCLIDTGDDAIAIRSCGYRLKDKSRHCEYVTITNCSLASCACVFRIGVGRMGELRHIRVSNIVAHRGGTLINYCTEYGQTARTPMSDVNFSNISATGISHALLMNSEVGVDVKHVTLENIRCEARAGSRLVTKVNGTFEDVRIRDFDVFLVEDPADSDPEIRAHRGEYALTCRGVTGLEMDHVRIFASEETRKRWKGMLQVEDCPGLEIKDCSF